jgi:hypothetical protein
MVIIAEIHHMSHSTVLISYNFQGHAVILIQTFHIPDIPIEWPYNLAIFNASNKANMHIEKHKHDNDVIFKNTLRCEKWKFGIKII